MWRAGTTPVVLTQWYPWVGWACVNNAVVAIGQGILLLLAWRRVDGGIRLADEGQS